MTNRPCEMTVISAEVYGRDGGTHAARAQRLSESRPKFYVDGARHMRKVDIA
jgi:hypothetical protein